MWGKGEGIHTHTYESHGFVVEKWVLGISLRKEFKDTLNKPSKQWLYSKEERMVHSKIAGVDRPGEKRLCQRTKRLRILF